MGKLIDADDLKRDLINKWDYPALIKARIESAPEVDPESLRPKGEWTVIEGDYWNEDVIYQCSACKAEFVTLEGTQAENLWNYCPNCGAKMEG